MVWRGQAKNLSFIGGSIVLLLSPSIANLRFSPSPHYHILVLYLIMWRNNSWFCERLPLCQGRGVLDFSGGPIVTLFRMTRLNASFSQSTVHYMLVRTHTLCIRVRVSKRRENSFGHSLRLPRKGREKKDYPFLLSSLPSVSVSSLALSYTVPCTVAPYNTTGIMYCMRIPLTKIIQWSFAEACLIYSARKSTNKYLLDGKVHFYLFISYYLYSAELSAK